MAAVLTAAVEFGPDHKMTLDAGLLQVLTAGDKVRMEAMLSNGRQQTIGQVAINVHAMAPAPGCFLLGVASNGNTALHLVASRRARDASVREGAVAGGHAQQVPRHAAALRGQGWAQGCGGHPPVDDASRRGG
ncbi:hypothetical protein ACQ4PT_011454 [Festuca glaucescens]